MVKDFATSLASTAVVLCQLLGRLASCEVKEMVKGRKMNVRDLGNPARQEANVPLHINLKIYVGRIAGI